MDPGHREQFERECDAAMGWIARLRSDTASEADELAFARWLAADPTRCGIIDKMLEVWDDLGCVRWLSAPDGENGNLSRQG